MRELSIHTRIILKISASTRPRKSRAGDNLGPGRAVERARIQSNRSISPHTTSRARGREVNATRIIRSIHLYLARLFVPSRARHVVDAKKRAPERGCLGCRDDVARDDRTARRRADAGDDGDARTSGREASAVSGPGRGRAVERGEINARKEERIQRYGADAGDERTSKHDAWARRERCR